MSEKKKQHGAGQLLPLFVSFLKIGAFTFGGGYAMIPLIQKEAADRHKWMTDEEIMEIVAIAESTPGPIAVNAATFTGYHAAGVPGAVLATIGVVMPAFLVIAAVSSALTLVSGNQWVKWVAPCSTAQSFIAAATALATSLFRLAPSSIVFLRDW